MNELLGILSKFAITVKFFTDDAKLYILGL